MIAGYTYFIKMSNTEMKEQQKQEEFVKDTTANGVQKRDSIAKYEAAKLQKATDSLANIAKHRGRVNRFVQLKKQQTQPQVQIIRK